MARAYPPDEKESRHLETLLLESDRAVLTSELTRVELARVMTAAERARRIPSAGDLFRLIDADLDREIGLVPLRPETVLPRAREIVAEHRVRTLDAIHLAVALDVREFEEEAVVFVTRDVEQAAAAKALGFELA